MERLSAKDFEQLTRCLREIYGCLDIDVLPGKTLDVLNRLVPSDISGYNEGDGKGGLHRLITRGISESEIMPPFRLLIDNIHEHPAFVHHFEQETNSRRPLKLSDFLTLPELKNRRIYDDFFRPLETRYQICFWPPTGAFALQRHRRDFSERDRAILEHLNFHYAQAWSNAVACRQLQQQCQRLSTVGSHIASSHRLTPREREILHWITEGKSNPEIAFIVGAQKRTIDKHVERILAKLMVENRQGAIRSALSMDL